MKKKTLYDEYLKDEEFSRLIAQEDLIMDVTESFCSILQEKRITRSKLAQIMGKTRGYISQLLNGKYNITLRSLSEVAYHLGYQVSINFKKKIAKREGTSIDVDWNLSQKKNFPEEKIKVADDYLDFGTHASRLAG